jgi:plastocyanin
MMNKGGRLWLLGIMGILCAGLYACASLPEISRTAIVHDIVISEELSQQNIVVKTGDEVRWINLRRQDITIDIPNLKSYDPSCQRGFSTPFGTLKESVTLKSNETASLCFSNQGMVRYIVRKETAQAGGKRVVGGSITVEN